MKNFQSEIIRTWFSHVIGACLSARISTRIATGIATGLSICLLLSAMQVRAGIDPAFRFLKGQVVARSLARSINPNTGGYEGDPTLVYLDASGNENGLAYTSYTGSTTDLHVISGPEYQAYVDIYDQLKLDYPKAILRSFSQMDTEAFVTLDNRQIKPTGLVDSEYGSYLIKVKADRYQALESDLIIHRFVVDLTDPLKNAANYVSVVLDPSGRVVLSSTVRVGFRLGHWGNPESPDQPGDSDYDFVNFEKQENTIYKPVTYTPVRTDWDFWSGYATTVTSGYSSDYAPGRFNFFYLMTLSCSCYGETYDNALAATVSYSNFHPGGRSYLDYTITRPFKDTCLGQPLFCPDAPKHFGDLAAIMAVSLSSTDTSAQAIVPDINFFIDLIVLNGLAKFVNVDGTRVEIVNDDKTRYEAFDAPADPNDNLQAQSLYDFDGDGVFDTSVKGHMIDQPVLDENGDPVLDESGEPELSGEIVFERMTEGAFTHQGIYLSSTGKTSTGDDPDAPDLLRIIDTKKELAPTGYLKQLSREDARNTDLYIFRESTGQLVTERLGLEEDAIGGQRYSNWNSADEEYIQAEGYGGFREDQSILDRFNYQIYFRGRDAPPNAVGGGRGTYENWAKSAKMTEPFLTREGDIIQTGESLRVIVINRATGYIGSARHLLGKSGNGVNEIVEEIELRPPNLRIWAERTYVVEKGATKDEDRDYIIGNEGAATLDDKQIVIHTQWLDHDGSAFPAAFAEDKGMTGRISRLTGVNTLAMEGDIATFSITPGLHKEVVKLSDNLTTAEHYYLHVSGQPKPIPCTHPSISCADFTTDSGVPAPYTYRPKLFTPFLTPVYNEDQSLKDFCIYQQVKRADGMSADEVAKIGTVCGDISMTDLAAADADKIEKPDGVYAWEYRPEYQFSQYDINVTGVNAATSLFGDPDTYVVNELIDEANPVLDITEEFLEILYEIGGSKYDPLTPIDGPKELVIKFGEEEQIVDLSKERITFENLAHIQDLAVEDYITIQLYMNGDSANILWEFAFYALGAAVDFNRDGVVSLDDETEGNTNTASNDFSNFFISSAIATVPAGDSVTSDKTSPENPFLFWVNNNYDVVNSFGVTRPDITNCDTIPQSEAQAVCEQWTQAGSTVTNISNETLLKRIESEKDLEDFAAMILVYPTEAATDGYPQLEEGQELVLKANNVSINLFKGVWKEGNDYLTDSKTMKDQVKRKLTFEDDKEAGEQDVYLFKLTAGESKPLDQSLINLMFGKDKEAKLIFEGIAESPESCNDDAKDCYISLVLKRGSTVLGETKIYMNIKDIKDFYDHYTVGTGRVDITPEPLNSSVTTVHAVDYKNKPYINKGLDQGFENEYIMMVHGWRMQYPERVAFAETAFKRLYWQGYKGKFGFFSWPTGWLDKPAHLYGLVAEDKVITQLDLDNYNDSEVIARRAGGMLSEFLTDTSFTGSDDSKKKIHIFAHSMGNVVVSEALRGHSQPIVENYIASQAATVAGGYKFGQEEINHDFSLIQKEQKVRMECAGEETGFKVAWGCYRVIPNLIPPIPPFYNPKLVSDITDFEIPPNKYKYQIGNIHGPTTPELELETFLEDSWVPTPHYSSLVQGVAGGKVINFFNEDDIALWGWESNQLAKPGFLNTASNTGADFSYHVTKHCEVVSGCPFPGRAPDANLGEKAVDHYESLIGIDRDMTWSDTTPIDLDSANILGQLTPARTKALGRVSATDSGEFSVINISEGFDFGGSNQGHSSQYYKNYIERSDYWNKLLFRFGFVVGE